MVLRPSGLHAGEAIVFTEIHALGNVF